MLQTGNKDAAINHINKMEAASEHVMNLLDQLANG
tara:strand:+ start:2087 stop:2191 length:105 start_codon:yes stop_codon:yes gene_type:complete